MMPLSLSLSDFCVTSFCTLPLLVLKKALLERDLDLDLEFDFDFDLDLDLDKLDFLEKGLLQRDGGDLDRLPLDDREDAEELEEFRLLWLERDEREHLPDLGLEFTDLRLFFLLLALSSSESSLIRLKSMSTSLSLSSDIFTNNKK